MPRSTSALRAARHRPAALPRRALTVTALALAATVGLALPASAHVTVGADDAHQGAADSVLTFRVPNEQTGASTVKIAISFPKATPLASVKPAPKPGWAFTTSKVTFNPPITTDDGTLTEGVGEVVYTASSAAAGIPDGGFDTFQILVGPVPEKATTLAFPTVQTYSNGRSVSWVAPVTDPANEPENPAPVLTLLPADDEKAAAGATASPGPGAAQASPSVSGSPVALAAPAGSASSATADDVSGARRLAVIALVVAVVAVLAGIAGVALGRRRG